KKQAINLRQKRTVLDTQKEMDTREILKEITFVEKVKEIKDKLKNYYKLQDKLAPLFDDLEQSIDNKKKKKWKIKKRTKR
ncbi:hypothetical protein RFI_31056, partial [Reticulomyxa filosa]